MKNILVFSAIVLVSSIAQAKEFKFSWIFGTNKLEYKTKAPNWDIAFDRASSFCYDYMVQREQNLTEDKGVAIIDVCSNPK